MKKIGITVGAFDLCHYGHILVFKEAKQVCDYLVVGLHTHPHLAPVSYRGKKKSKPIMSIKERYAILKAIKYIDKVFLYKTEKELLQKLKEIDWDVRIIGVDWKGKKLTGWNLKKGEIYYNSRNHNHSTTELKRRIVNASNKELDKI